MANILVSDGKGLEAVAPEDSDNPLTRSFMHLLENMDHVLWQIYSPGHIYSIVLPHPGDADFVDASEFLIRFDFDDYPDTQEEWDARDPEEMDAAISQARGAIGAFVDDLRQQAEAMKFYGPADFGVSEAKPGSLLIRASDPRKILYAFGMLAAQHGYNTKLYPIAREGLPLPVVTDKLAHAADSLTLHGRVYAFVNRAGNYANKLPGLPHRMERIAKTFDAIGISAGVPPFFSIRTEDDPSPGLH